MSRRWSVPLLICAALGGYVLGGKSLQAQPDASVFRIGETVTFVFGPDWSRVCRIEETRGVFVRCQNDPGVAAEYWINTTQIAGVQKRGSPTRAR